MDPSPRLLVHLAALRWMALLVMLAGVVSPALAGKTYSDNGDGTVTDPTTTLVWMRCLIGQTWDGNTCAGTASTYTWDQAMALTGTVNFAGQSDWRLPTIRELQTIVDRSVSNPALDSWTFPNTPASYFWSASASASNSSVAWIVHFDYGAANYSYKPSGYQVRLVRSGQSSGLLDIARPSTDYVDQGDGTVTHTPTGLVWQRCAVGQSWTGGACNGTASTFTWDKAKQLTGSFAGETDWRLPTEEELLSLVDYSQSQPAINGALFPNTDPSYFWSASAYAYDSGSAWLVTFHDGFTSDLNKPTHTEVRLVRSGKSFGLFPLSVSKTGTGQVSSSVIPGIDCGTLCIGGYNPGDVVTLNALPPANLIAWGGACASAGSSASCFVTMNAANAVSASFKNPPLQLQVGWNLLGNGQDQALAVATVLGDPANVATVWKWDVSTSGWQFYAPAMTPAALQAYATGKGYGVLTTVNPGEGFWVNAARRFAATLPSGATLTGHDFALGQVHALKRGWSLAAIGDAVTPSAFNLALNASPPVAGVVPINLTTLWVWDNLLAQWNFYSPALEGQGGTALLDYATSKGYLDFGTTGKTLGNGVGFWVNKPW